MEPMGGEIGASTALVVSLGGLDLEVEEISWDELAALQSAPVVLEAVAFEDLSPQQQGMVRQMLAQLDQLPPGMVEMVLPDAIAQIEAGLRSAPEEERPMLMHMLGVIKARLAALGG